MKSFLCRFLALGFVLIPVMALGQSPAPASTPSVPASAGVLLIKPGQQVVFLGDSTVQGGWSSASGFIHLVSLGLAKENVEIKASELGVQGNRTQELLDLYDKNVATMTPKADWLVVNCGMDEVRRGLPGSDLETFQANMKSLVDEAKTAGLSVIILTTNMVYESGSPFDEKLEPYNDALRALAKSENCPLVDINAAEKAALPTLPVVQGNQKLLSNEATLNTHGQRLVASEILKAFGVNVTQLAEIQESWLDTPKSATVGANITRPKGNVPITLREFNGLETFAANEKQRLQDMLDKAYVADVITALRGADASSDITAVQGAAQSSFEKNVADFLKQASTLPATTTAAAAQTASPAPAPAASTTTNAAPLAVASGNVLVKSGQKVAFMGDSITQFGWQHPSGYVNLIVRGLATVGVQVEPVPAGVSGNTSRDMLGRLKGSVLDKTPDWMTLSCGVNDVWHGPTGCDLETYKKNITSILDQAQQAKIQVVILTATKIQEGDNPNNQKLAAYNDFLREQAKERKLPLADLNEAEDETLKAIPADAPYKHLTVDGVHMNPHGDQMMALGVLKAFGLTDAQLAQVKEHWLDEPNGASVDGNAVFGCSIVSTLRASDALEQLALSEKKLVSDYLTPVYLQALIEQAKADATQTDLAAIQTGAQKLFEQKVADLVKNPPAPASPMTTPAPTAPVK